jgi:hypothetical protein
MIHHASWKALFTALNAVNESGNRNIAGFTNAMDAGANLEVKMTRLSQPFGLLLIANNSKEVSIIPHPHNFGGTLLRPTHKVECLVGMGPNATLVILDHRSALGHVTAVVPPIGDIKACLTAEALAALPIPRPCGVVNLEGISCFIPAPFLRNAILSADSFAPLALVLAGRAAQDDHVRDHNEDKGFSEANIDAHMDHFYLWCLGVHQKQVSETRFTVAPDDDELSEWSTRLHCEHILPSLSAAAAVPASTEDTANLLCSIAAGMSCSTEEAENQNKIQREQLDFIKEKEVKKKNKAEKWHPTSRRLVLNAASTNSDSPAENIPVSYLTVINSDTAGMADKELQSQMARHGHSDAGFAHGLTASLYAGDIKWNN